MILGDLNGLNGHYNSHNWSGEALCLWVAQEMSMIKVIRQLLFSLFDRGV